MLAVRAEVEGKAKEKVVEIKRYFFGVQMPSIGYHVRCLWRRFRRYLGCLGCLRMIMNGRKVKKHFKTVQWRVRSACTDGY